jgi:adenylate cyclase
LIENRVERRLAAILAADVAGYSRLMGVDEEGVLAQLKAVRKLVLEPSIAAHRGRIVKTTGDGALVEFVSAVDAARCAVDVQRSMAEQNATVPPVKRIEFRIGIHVGDIMIDENDIFGDGVNIAARLEGVAEPGGIIVSARVYEDATGKVEAIFHDLGEQHLKNIARPVHAYRVRPATDETGRTLAHPSSAPPVLQTPDKPSIAVLPFQNVSNDPEQEFLAIGMTEDIITLLSQTHDFLVIAHSSTLAYKTKSVDVVDVGRQLNVRYVLEGSVRRAGNRIRVTAQLVDTRTRNHIWGDRYDRDLSDLFAVQDDVTSGIIGTLHPQLFSAEAASYQRLPPDSLNAWGFAVRGMMSVLSFTQQNLDSAAELATRAIEISPDYSLAYGVRALALGYRAYTAWSADWLKDARQCSADIKRALSLSSDDPTVLFLVGCASNFMGRHRTALTHLERAVQLNPNLAMAHATLTNVYASVDRPIEGLQHIEIAFRLSPRDPMAGLFYGSQALCNFVAGKFETAVSCAERGININPGLVDNYLYMAAALLEIGEFDRAKAQIERAQRLAPKVTLHVIERAVPGNPGFDRYHKALRRAGLPE